MSLDNLKANRQKLEALGTKVAQALTMIIMEIRRKENMK